MLLHASRKEIPMTPEENLKASGKSEEKQGEHGITPAIKDATHKAAKWWEDAKESMGDAAQSVLAKGVKYGAWRRATRYMNAHGRDLSIGAIGGIVGATAILGFGSAGPLRRSARLAILASLGAFLLVMSMPEMRKKMGSLKETLKDSAESLKDAMH